MELITLSLVNFRNYAQREFKFDSGVSVMVGKNTAGKTNLLEAVYLLATGESFREGKIEEMVNWEGEVGHVVGKVSPQQILNPKSEILNNDKISNSNDQNEIGLQVSLTRGVVQGGRVSKRRYLVNGVPRSRQKLLGNLVVVCFRPEDMRIVEGSPGRRRNFLDGVLVQVDPEYGRSLGSYSRGLVRRNKVLQMIREGRTNRTALAFWDQLVVKEGMVIQDRRREVCDFFNRFKVQGLRLENEGEDFFDSLKVEYRPSVMSEKRLAQYEYEEVAAGHTLVGPHRDDFGIIAKNPNYKLQITKQAQNSRPKADQPMAENIKYKNEQGRDLAIYGSRGEQRLGVLWLKLMSMEYVEHKLGVRPVLLLDDIFSELDSAHRKLVWGVVGRQQTIVTTADENQVGSLIDGYKLMRL